MIKAHRIGVCVLALAAAAQVQAGGPAGTVKTVSGQVIVERDKQKFPATVGAPIEVSDTLRTGPDGAVGVTLHDSTLLSAGPRSTMVIDKFLYDSKTNEGRISVGVRKGTLAVATGKIAKRSPESVDFHTPTSTLGVRGTEFVIDVGAGSDE